MRSAGGRARAGGRRERIRRIGAISGPVRPSTISSAAMSPSSRCSIMCTYSSSWLAEPSEVSAAADHDEAPVEAGLAPAGHRMVLDRERAHAAGVEQPEDRQRARAGGLRRCSAETAGGASGIPAQVTPAGRPTREAIGGSAGRGFITARPHESPGPSSAATAARRPGGARARAAGERRGARDRRQGRPADTGVAVQLGGRDRARGLVRRAVDDVEDARSCSDSTLRRLFAAAARRWSGWPGSSASACSRWSSTAASTAPRSPTRTSR